MAPAGAGPSGIVPIDPIRLARQYYKLVMLAVVLGAAMGVGAHFLFLRFYPTWTAFVEYECTDPTFDITELRGGNQGRDEFERFMGTQVAIMTSEPILERVVNDGEVRSLPWAKRYLKENSFQTGDAVMGLQKAVQARIVPRTSLIRLSMSSHELRDVAPIANKVDFYYREKLKEAGNADTASRRQALSDRRNNIETELKILKGKRDDLIVKNQIDTLNLENSADSMKIDALQQSIVENTQYLAAARSRLADYAADYDSDSGTPTYGDDLRL